MWPNENQEPRHRQSTNGNNLSTRKEYPIRQYRHKKLQEPREERGTKSKTSLASLGSPIAVVCCCWFFFRLVPNNFAWLGGEVYRQSKNYYYMNASVLLNESPVLLVLFDGSFGREEEVPSSTTNTFLNVCVCLFCTWNVMLGYSNALLWNILWFLNG